jgi:hypothetical protein
MAANTTAGIFAALEGVTHLRSTASTDVLRIVSEFAEECGGAELSCDAKIHGPLLAEEAVACAWCNRLICALCISIVKKCDVSKQHLQCNRCAAALKEDVCLGCDGKISLCPLCRPARVVTCCARQPPGAPPRVDACWRLRCGQCLEAKCRKCRTESTRVTCQACGDPEIVCQPCTQSMTQTCVSWHWVCLSCRQLRLCRYCQTFVCRDCERGPWHRACFVLECERLDRLCRWPRRRQRRKTELDGLGPVLIKPRPHKRRRET